MERKTIELTCARLGCGKRFMAGVREVRFGKKYCSRSCHYLGARIVRKCLKCGVEFRKAGIGPRRKYCSQECSTAVKKYHRHADCLVCGQSFLTSVSKTNYFCSLKCATIHRYSPELERIRLC